MADFSRRTANLATVGAQASLQSRLRQVALSPTIEATPLPLGNSHLTLPEWSVRNGGPTVFRLVGNDGGSNLTGMGGEAVAVETIEWAILGAIILLVSTSGVITATPDDPESPEGSRFASAVSMSAGQSQAFVCSQIDGVKMWFPIGGSATVDTAHYEAKDNDVAIANGGTTTILDLTGISAPTVADAVIKFEATISYKCDAASLQFSTLFARLVRDGSSSIVEVTVPVSGVAGSGEGEFDLYATVPFVWFDGISNADPHTYSLEVTPDPAIDGTQTAQAVSLMITFLPEQT